MARPAASYRKARRNDARDAKLPWRQLPSGISADGSILIALGLRRPAKSKPSAPDDPAAADPKGW